MQYALFLAGFLAFTLMFFLLPETSHPGSRGIDRRFGASTPGTSKIFRTWVWLNPLSGLALLRSPNLLAVVSNKCNSSVDAEIPVTLDSCWDCRFVNGLW